MQKLLLIITLFSASLISQNEDSWLIDDIRISGLQRVSAGSVFAVMPVGLGDLVNRDLLKEITLSIFETEKFWFARQVDLQCPPRASTIFRKRNFENFKIQISRIFFEIIIFDN